MSGIKYQGYFFFLGSISTHSFIIFCLFQRWVATPLTKHSVTSSGNICNDLNYFVVVMSVHILQSTWPKGWSSQLALAFMKRDSWVGCVSTFRTYLSSV